MTLSDRMPDHRNNGRKTGNWSDLCRAWAAANASDRRQLVPLFLQGVFE